MSALHQTTDQTETESFPAVGLAAPIPAQRLASSMAARMLLSGGDERLSIDPATGRNRYLTSPTPRDDETPFGSSTANTITRLGYRAAVADLGRVLAVDHGRRNTIQEWIETQRASLIARFGNRDSDLVFASSGTDTELFAVLFATIVAGSPLTNVLMAPAETGSGVPFAARGERFLSSTPFGGAKPPGERLEGMEHLDIELETIAILDSRGNPRPAEDVDDDAFRVVSAALAKGRSALLHLLDVSKTGGGGPSLAAARQIAALAPGRVVVAVDCCQMRSSAQRVKQYVDAGFLVMLTGSKFAGGPPFSGAMIAPREVFEQARISKSPLPPGWRASTALLDWPESFRARAAPTAGVHVNLGLALRWSASLSEIDRFSELSSDLATQVAAAFEVHVRAVAEGSRHHHPSRWSFCFIARGSEAPGASARHRGGRSPQPARTPLPGRPGGVRWRQGGPARLPWRADDQRHRRTRCPIAKRRPRNGALEGVAGRTLPQGRPSHGNGLTASIGATRLGAYRGIRWTSQSKDPPNFSGSTTRP